jgi:hypothetical protein
MKKYILFLTFCTTMSSGFKMTPLHKLPIVTAYKNIDKHIEAGLNNELMRSKIALISSHGLTDLISLNPNMVIPRYFNAACLCFYTNNDIRAILIFLFSIYHFSRDMIGTGVQKLTQSLLLHTIFIYKPEQVINYLFLIHTPIHFYRFFKTADKKWFPVILIITNLISIIPYKNNDINFIKMFSTFGVLGHIMSHTK